MPRVVLVTGSSGVVGGAVAALAESTGWTVRGVDLVSGPRTQLIGDLRDARIRRRALDGAAHLLAMTATVTGTYNVAGPLLFEPADTEQLCSDAAALLRRRHPGIAAAFAARRWPLPRYLDRVYDSRAALAALGYRPQHDVLRLLGPVAGGASVAFR